LAGLETRDTAGLETCATGLGCPGEGVSLQVLQVWVLHVATERKIGVSRIPKVRFYWQFERFGGEGRRKGCNEKVMFYTHFVAIKIKKNNLTD
jgi:hypothetical protein